MTLVLPSISFVLTFTLLFHYGLGSEKCKEMIYIGGPLLNGSMRLNNILRIFLGKDYNISHDGDIVAWKFVNNLAGSKFFLDVWKKVSDYKYELIHKTEVSNPQLGVNTMRTSPIQVGNHSLFSKILLLL